MLIDANQQDQCRHPGFGQRKAQDTAIYRQVPWFLIDIGRLYKQYLLRVFGCRGVNQNPNLDRVASRSPNVCQEEPLFVHRLFDAELQTADFVSFDTKVSQE